MRRYSGLKKRKTPMRRKKTDEVKVKPSPLLTSLIDYAHENWGVPDCVNCAAHEGCTIWEIWGANGEGKPTVQGCSNYVPVNRKEHTNAKKER